MASDDIASYLRDLTLKEVSILGKKLGDGSYGKVFTVQYRGNTYAAKEIHSILVHAANQEEKERIKRNFLMECFNNSKLSHHNIVSFKGVFYPDEKSFLPVMVMELMEDSLTEYVRKQVLDMETKFSILYDISSGLNYLHSYEPPMIHRDLSPNNILLITHKQKLVAKISDLGVTKVVKANSRAKLTKAPGTANFMPPEALMENPRYDISLDIFSYAGIVLHVVNQEWPTPCDSILRDPNTNKVLGVLSEVKRRQEYLDKMSSTDKVLEPLVIACLNDDPAKRPATATVLRILELLVGSQDHADSIVTSTDLGIPKDRFCLLVLKSGQSTENSLVCCLKLPVTKIGRQEANEWQDIQLRGPGIEKNHCLMEVKKAEVFITPLSAARVLVNGKIIKKERKLNHHDRVLLGINHFFLLKYPKNNVATAFWFDDKVEEMYNLAVTEVIKEELDCPKKMKDNECSRLGEAFAKAKELVKEANRMCNQATNKDTVCKVGIQIPPNLLKSNVLDRGKFYEITGKEIAIRVLQKALKIDCVWSTETFEKKVAAMKRKSLHRENRSTGIDTSLLFELKQPALLGVANILMNCLFHCIHYEYDVPLVGQTEKVYGSLKLSLERVQGLDDVEGELSQAVGSQIAVKIHVMKVTGLHSAYCHSVFGQYKLWDQSEPTTFNSVQVPYQRFVKSDGDKSLNLRVDFDFNHTQLVEVKVTEDFLNYVKYGTMSIEVYGCYYTATDTDTMIEIDSDCKIHSDHKIDSDHKTDGNRKRCSDRKRDSECKTDSDRKSFPDRCHNIMKNVEMWIEILNKQGKCVPVEDKCAKTGGVYVVQKGNPYNIKVKVVPVEGSGGSTIQFSHITSMAIGNIYCTDEPLDSYQDDDLRQLRSKWVDALKDHIEYTDREFRKVVPKKGKNEKMLMAQLMEQLTTLHGEMDSLQCPKPNSGIPGTQANPTVTGMEQRVVTLHLDLNEHMLTPSDHDNTPVTTITAGQLIGENANSMMDLDIVKINTSVLEATAKWIPDNDIIASGNKVYAIVNVSVMLKHCNAELVLRKRICLHCKQTGLSKLTHLLPSGYTRTGVMYEIVTGMPKLEGKLYPPKFPSKHPSFIELAENDDVVEKYTKMIMSIENTLTDDKSKQETSLMENLAAETGKEEIPKFIFTHETSKADSNQALERQNKSIERSASLRSLKPKNDIEEENSQQTHVRGGLLGERAKSEENLHSALRRNYGTSSLHEGRSTKSTRITENPPKQKETKSPDSSAVKSPRRIKRLLPPVPINQERQATANDQ